MKTGPRYTPKAFELTDSGSQQQLIHDYPLGTLIVQGDNGLAATHLPFLYQPGSNHGPASLQAHIAQINTEFCSLADKTPVLVVFQGPHAYISPSWYPTKARTGGKAVPTWNYVSVHVHGTLGLVADPAWLLAHLEKQTVHYEQGRLHPWSVSDAPPCRGSEKRYSGAGGSQEPKIGSVFNQEVARSMQKRLQS